MNRKSFINQSAVLSAGLLINPAKFLIDGKTIYGHGNKRYRLETHWSKADAAKYPVNNCHEMIQDRKGRLFLLTDDTHNNIIIYSKKGKVLGSWGKEYPGAHGLTLFDENGTEVLFICDNQRHQVIKTTLDGRVLMTLNYPKETGEYTKEEEYIPTETAIAANGDIYVADGYGKDFIIQYDSKGNYIRHFGGRGEQDKHLKNAHGICVDTRDGTPKLIVSSRQQFAFKQYTMQGQYLGTIPLPGAWVCRPVIKGEYLYAAVLQSKKQAGSFPSGFVTILDKNNKNISNIGGSAPLKPGNDNDELIQEHKIFQYPHDVCIDDDENVYVPQWNSGKVYPYKLKPV